MTTPIVEVDFRLVAGDGFQRAFIAYSVAPLTPMNLAGWSGGASIRATFDPTYQSSPLVTMTTSTPSPNGSTLAIQAIAPIVYPDAAMWTLVGADTLLLSSGIPAAAMAKVFYNVWVTPPGGQPVTLSAGAMLVRTRV